MTLPRLNAGDGWLLLTVAVWGLNFPVAKFVLDELDPHSFVGVRWAIAATTLVILVLLRERNLRVPWRDFWMLAGLGTLGVATFQMLWTIGLSLTTAAKGSILVSTTPIFAAIGGALLGHGLSARAWFGTFVGFLGVFVLINNSITEITLGGGTIEGDVMMLGVAALWAIYSAAAAPLIARHGALKTTFWIVLVGTAFLLVITFPATSTRDWSSVSALTWGGIFYSAVFSAGLSFVWWYEGIRLLGATRAMLYSYLIPVFGIACSAAVLGDVMSPVQFLGAAIALSGIVMARRS